MKRSRSRRSMAPAKPAFFYAPVVAPRSGALSWNTDSSFVDPDFDDMSQGDLFEEPESEPEWVRHVEPDGSVVWVSRITGVWSPEDEPPF